jgi:hypothetical protein
MGRDPRRWLLTTEDIFYIDARVRLLEYRPRTSNARCRVHERALVTAEDQHAETKRRSAAYIHIEQPVPSYRDRIESAYRK